LAAETSVLTHNPRNNSGPSPYCQAKPPALSEWRRR
jgi:hypothetical protein